MADVICHDQPPVLREDLEKTIRAIPMGQDIIGINFEPSSGAWQYLNYFKHPAEAVLLREALVERVRLARPDADFLLYTLPGGVNQVTNDMDRYAPKIIERELAFRDVSEGLWKGSISGYWKGWHTPKTWDTWRRRQDFAIAMCTTIHNRKPIAFVWDGSSPRVGAMPWEEFAQIMQYYYDRDIDVIYWSYWSQANRKPIDPGTKWVLWNYANKP